MMYGSKAFLLRIVFKIAEFSIASGIPLLIIFSKEALFSELVFIKDDFLLPGEDSGRIVVWNTGPVVEETMESDENVPKMLCQIDDHTGARCTSFMRIYINSP